MATRFGGAGTPAFQIVRAPTDHGTGLMAAFAIGLALLERERSGLGQHVHASLAGTAALLQSSLMYDFEGRRWDEVQGQQVLGSNAFQRLYRTSDGWVYLGSTPGRTATIRRALGLKGDEPLEAALETTLASYTTAEAVRVFRAQGLSAHELCSLRDLIDDRGLRARGLVVTRRHGELGDVDQLGPVVRLSRTPTTLGHPATPLGSEAREIIELAGMSGVSSQLQEAGAVRLLSDVF
jgi:crotonobetainyl-CoA:carnitine CoA-transferase CaiB-like acyl-CoA transferase